MRYAIFGMMGMFALASCNTGSTPVARYDIYTENVLTLSEYRGNEVSLGEFTSSFTRPVEADGQLVSETGHSEVQCILSALLVAPEGQTFGDYIRSAFATELTTANIYSESSQTVLNADILWLDFNRIQPIGLSWIGGTWQFEVVVSSSNSRKLEVEYSYAFSTGYEPTNCETAAEEFVPAVQNLIGEILAHDDFSSLLES